MAFPLTINTLGGTSLSLHVNMDTTVVEICNRLVDLVHVPWLHDVQICSGDQVLYEGSVTDAGLSADSNIEVVVQPSAAKAIDFMQHAINYLRLEKLKDRESFFQAAQILGKSKGLTRDQGHSLFCSIGADCFLNYLALTNADDSVLQKIIKAVAEAYGRCCDNATLHIPILLGKIKPPIGNIRNRAYVTIGVFIALEEMQLESDQMPEVMVNEFVEKAHRFFLALPPLLSYSALQIHGVRKACALAGRLGGKSTIPLLQRVQDFGENQGCQEIVQAAAAAVATIQAQKTHGAGAQSHQETARDVLEQKFLSASFDEISGIEGFDGGHLAPSSSHREPPTLGEDSETDPLQLEQADLHEAMLRSKADARNADGVVIVRLTSNSPVIRNQLLNTKLLEPCFETIRSANCEISPSWANGALFLIPMTHDQVVESQIELKAHNVVLLSSDLGALKAAVKQIPKRKRQRAEVKPEHEADRADAHHNEEEMFPMVDLTVAMDNDNEEDRMVALEIENTFLNFPVHRLDISESSDIVWSAPADASEIENRWNPRRWRNQ